MTASERPEGCVCGHGPMNHGDGWTFIGRFFGHDSRCIRCSCMEFRRVQPDSPGGAA